MTVIMTPPRTYDLGGGHYIGGFASVNTDTWAAHVEVDETCTNKVAGFTGGAMVLFYDIHGSQLGESPAWQFGLGQAPIIGASHRHVNEDLQAPAGTELVQLNLYWAPKDRFNDIVKGIEDALSTIGKALEWLKKFCDENPDMCDWVHTSISGTPQP